MIGFRPVGYIIGWLILGLGGLMIVPFLVDLAHGDPNARAFAVAAILAMLIGAATAVACAEDRRVTLSLRQGFLLTAGSWAIFPAFAGLPLMLGAPHLGFTDAYFEFTSALTTTGSTVIVGLDQLPQGALLWRCMVTWVGGIGVILLAMILLPVLNIGGMQMLKSADFNTLGKIMPEARSIALSIGSVYVVLTLACTLAYLWAGMPGFDAVAHGFSTVATGGMANRDNSFADFSPAVQWIATVFMLLGAMSFSRFVQFARGEPKALFQDSQIRAFLTIYLCLAAGLLAARLLASAPLSVGTVREVLFSLASVITTTGFAATDYSLWGPFAETIFFCAMMICGCSGSTSGGPKVFRYQLLLGAVHGEVRRLHSPSTVFTPRFQGVAVTDEVMDSVIAFFMLFFLTLGLGAVALVLLELDPVSAISGAAASLTNVGPGLGPVLGPAGTYAPLPDAAKWVCSFLMLVGRLEIMTAYVLFTVAFWRG
ncbi:TrkH family potassium uptake protein [Amaricoccus sp.]|uniref:TrkH family potassium uptake protein n=1 Tax=Amaricoccus sp. TaxID=1872485 RepID=UPI00262246CA|nr:TrkH family potassium uptake protein [Amaricoccus sp.]HRO11655.1 TrkH family potassium uptake protein [Amaricoccus sp.]